MSKSPCEKKQENKKENKNEEVKAENFEKDIKDLTDELEVTRSEAKGHYDKLLRIMAEFENFKKRITREQSDHIKYGNESVLKALIPVIDDFERILDHIPDGSSKEVKAIAEGMELVHKNLFKVLSEFGLKEVDVKGSFDHDFHEAVSCVPSPNHPEGKIIEVHRKGYLLYDRLLRPASVTISKGEV